MKKIVLITCCLMFNKHFTDIFLRRAFRNLLKVTLALIFIFNTTTLVNVQKIGTGISFHTIVQKADEKVYTRENNGNGHLENKRTTKCNVLIDVSSFGALSDETITAIGAVRNHSILQSEKFSRC